MLKILHLSLSAFRGIPGRIDIDLSAPLTLIYAPNGTGKTSFIDAAEWIVTGGIRRMGPFLKRGTHEGLRCKFSPGEIRTEVSAAVELNGIGFDLSRTPERWLLSNGDLIYGTGSAILKKLAPEAVDEGTDHGSASIIRRIWLRGTRFLTESDLSILVETGPYLRDVRRHILSDLLGVRELDNRADEFGRFIDQLNNGCKGEMGIYLMEKELGRKSRGLEARLMEADPVEGGSSATESEMFRMLRARETEGLRREISALKERLARLKKIRSRAREAIEAFNERSMSYCRWQRASITDAMFSIFGRIHANETFDLLQGGSEDDPFEWIAMAARQELVPSREFSMGQRQDLALSIFLAKARGIGGTFFLDEPIIRLDDLNRVALLDTFRVLVEEEDSKVSLVITTASRSLVRHFQEKFNNVPPRGNVPALRVVELEGSPRDGVKVLRRQ